jgi:hypothetical protein
MGDHNAYIYKPEKSFVAACYWQRQPMTAENSSFQGLHRIGSTFDPTPFSTERWLHAGGDDFTGNHVPDYIKGKTKFLTQFWFGCYETDGEYDYEIRAAGEDNDHQHFNQLNHRLDVSTNGYLRLYSADEPLGHDPLVSGTMMWRLEGVRPDEIAEGSTAFDVKLWSLHGQQIKLLKEDGFPYLNEKSGKPGWLAMKVIRMGVSAL